MEEEATYGQTLRIAECFFVLPSPFPSCQSPSKNKNPCWSRTQKKTNNKNPLRLLWPWTMNPSESLSLEMTNVTWVHVPSMAVACDMKESLVLLNTDPKRVCNPVFPFAGFPSFFFFLFPLSFAVVHVRISTSEPSDSFNAHGSDWFFLKGERERGLNIFNIAGSVRPCNKSSCTCRVLFFVSKQGRCSWER